MIEQQSFIHEDFGTVRVVEQDDTPWFVLKDVCDAIDIGNSRMVFDRLDNDEKGVSQIDTPGGIQSMNVINESGLYNVILRSDKPGAKKFKRWITHEVLPALRKTGSYSVSAPSVMPTRSITTDDYLRAAAIVANCRNERLPYVLNFLAQGGFSVQQIGQTQKSAQVSPQHEVARLINVAIEEHGLSITKIGKLTGLQKQQISRYRTGRTHPKEDRAQYLIETLVTICSQNL